MTRTLFFCPSDRVDFLSGGNQRERAREKAAKKAPAQKVRAVSVRAILFLRTLQKNESGASLNKRREDDANALRAKQAVRISFWMYSLLLTDHEAAEAKRAAGAASGA